MSIPGDQSSRIQRQTRVRICSRQSQVRGSQIKIRGHLNQEQHTEAADQTAMSSVASKNSQLGASISDRSARTQMHSKIPLAWTWHDNHFPVCAADWATHLKSFASVTISLSHGDLTVANEQSHKCTSALLIWYKHLVNTSTCGSSKMFELYCLKCAYFGIFLVCFFSEKLLVLS